MPNDSQIDDQNDGLEGDYNSKPPSNQTDKNQKIMAAGLAVFAFLIVILWSVQLKNNIYGPLNQTGAAESALSDSQTASDLALKNKDTDADGLSDYDELNLYKTSPYLADSDSDGISDGVEVKNGTDPNCPQGRTCANGGLNENSTASGTPASTDILNNLSSQSQALNSLLNQYGAANPAAGSVNPPASPAGGSAANGGTGSLTDEQKQALKGLDAASLRQLLIEAGMAKETLDKISDDQLMKSYNETLQ